MTNKTCRAAFLSILMALFLSSCGAERQPAQPDQPGYPQTPPVSSPLGAPLSGQPPLTTPPTPVTTPTTPPVPPAPTNPPAPTPTISDLNALKELAKDEAVARFQAIKNQKDSLNSFFLPVGNTSLAPEVQKKIADNLSAVLPAMSKEEMKKCLIDKCLEFEPNFSDKFTAILNALGPTHADIFLEPFLETAFVLRPDIYIGIFLNLLKSIDGRGPAVEKALFNTIISRIAKPDLVEKYLKQNYMGWSANPGMFKFMNYLIAFALDNNMRPLYEYLDDNNPLFLTGALSDTAAHYKGIFTAIQKNKLLTWITHPLYLNSVRKWDEDFLRKST